MKYETTDYASAVQEVSLKINQSLTEGSVLLLLSGGSNIRFAVDVRENLNIVNQLTVGLIDERYGDVGHGDSNWQQLVEAGYSLSELEPLPVLNGDSVEQTTGHYLKELTDATNDHDTVIAIFGIGKDGHTSGVLPHSQAVTASNIVVTYDGPDYQRITTTPAYFSHIDQAYLVALDDSKQGQLENLFNKDLPIAVQPAQSLKRTKNLIIFGANPINEDRI